MSFTVNSSFSVGVHFIILVVSPVVFYEQNQVPFIHPLRVNPLAAACLDNITEYGQSASNISVYDTWMVIALPSHSETAAIERFDTTQQTMALV